jgi:ABC-2 type transport system ATP-binding protein
MLKQGRIAALDTMQNLLARMGGTHLEDAFVRIMHGENLDGEPEDRGQDEDASMEASL